MSEKLSKANQSLEKAFTLIEVLAANSTPMRLTAAAQAAGLPPSTAMRLLHTLETMGYVEQSDKTLRYSLSRKFGALCEVTKEKTDLTVLAHPIMAQLSASVRECVCLGEEQDGQVVYLDCVEPEGSTLLQRCVRIGKRAPLYCTAQGKFFLSSNYTSDALGKYMRRNVIQPFTPATLVSLNEMQMELNRCERHGYALDSEECELGISCMAVGIWDYTQRVIAAISVVAPVERLSTARVRALYTVVQDAAEEISKRMGFRGEFPRGEFNFD